MSGIDTGEKGARSIPATPSIDYGAVLPFKKRRFLFILPPSPPPLHDESAEAKRTESSDGSVVLKSSVVGEHHPASVEEPSFRLDSLENINLNEVDGAHSDDQDKHFSLSQKRPEFSEGQELSPLSDAPNVYQNDRTWGSTGVMSVPSGSCESEAIQEADGHQKAEGCGISADFTLELGQNIEPVCLHQANSSLSGRESEHFLVGIDRSNWDLNTTMEDCGGSALVFSHGTAPCGNSISDLRNNDKKDAGQNLHSVERRSVGDRTTSSYDFEEHHPGRCLDLALRASIPCTSLRHESPSVCAIYNPVLHLSTTVELDNSKGISSLSRVKIEPPNEPIDFCDRKTENRSGKCGSIGSLQFGTHRSDSRSIKVETDFTNQQMNMMDENSSSRQEVTYFSALLPKESKAKRVSGPSNVESCRSVLASSVGCKDGYLIENDDDPMGRSSHRPEGDANNVSADCTVTYIATNGSQVQTSNLVITARDENNKKWDDMAKFMPKGNCLSAAKEIVKNGDENSSCNGEKIENSGCEDSNTCGSNYESDRFLRGLADHAEISDEEDNDYEDGEVREQLVFGVSRASRGAEQVENIRAGEYYCPGVTSTDLSLAFVKANVEFQVTATASCTPNVDKGLSQSRELPLNERVSSDLSELLHGDLTKRIKKEMVSIVENAPSVTQHGVNKRVQTDSAISIIEGKEDGNSLPESEVLVSSELTSEDANLESNKTRIITLSSLSSVSSPGKARSITNQHVQMRSVRKILPDMALEVDKPHPRGRNRARADEFDKLSRGRNQYSLYRNSRSKFGWDRGTISSSIILNRDVKRELNPELCNYPVECETSRCRSRYASEGCWNGDEPRFHRQSSTRHSPGRRDGALTHAMPRDINPVRCNGMDDFDMVSSRSHSKFRRDPRPRDDTSDSMFACSRISCDYDASGIAYADRKLHSFKSSRSNSPVIRSRSPEGFRGHLELFHRRSRSPGQGCFRGKNMRRQIHSERDRVFLGSRLTSRRSPGRGTFRIKRYRVNTRDRDRPCSEYSKDINRQGQSDQRSPDEQGEHGHFPSPYDKSDASEVYSTDEAAAPYHFLREDRAGYRERGNSRVKLIDRTKNRSGYSRKSQTRGSGREL